VAGGPGIREPGDERPQAGSRDSPGGELGEKPPAAKFKL